MVLKYFSYSALIAVLFVGYTLSVLWERYSKEKRIRKLGDVAPKCKTWAPWGARPYQGTFVDTDD
jgi:hypothetical protein